MQQWPSVKAAELSGFKQTTTANLERQPAHPRVLKIRDTLAYPRPRRHRLPVHQILLELFSFFFVCRHTLRSHIYIGCRVFREGGAVCVSMALHEKRGSQSNFLGEKKKGKEKEEKATAPQWTNAP